MTLSQLKPGTNAVIQSLRMSETTQVKLMEMGLVPGETVRFHRTAPMGDPIEIEVLGYRLAIRCAEADQIDVIPL